MPTFVELQNRIKRTKQAPVHLGSDEMLIVDERAAMRPGDFVEEKLRAACRLDTCHTTASQPVLGNDGPVLNDAVLNDAVLNDSVLTKDLCPGAETTRPSL
jgi:hypothetical protein